MLKKINSLLSLFGYQLTPKKSAVKIIRASDFDFAKSKQSKRIPLKLNHK